MILTKDEFVSVLVDCRGESREDAEMTADEYRNNIESYVSDIGGDEDSLASIKKYLSK